MRCCSGGGVNSIRMWIVYRWEFFLCSISSYDSTREVESISGNFVSRRRLKFDDFSVKCLFVLFFLPLMMMLLMFALSIYEIVRDSREEWRLIAAADMWEDPCEQSESIENTKHNFQLDFCCFSKHFFYICWFTRKRLFKQKRETEKTEEGSQLPRYPSGVKSDRETSQILISPPSAPFGAHSQLGVFALLWVSLSFSAFFYRKLFSSLFVFFFVSRYGVRRGNEQFRQKSFNIIFYLFLSDLFRLTHRRGRPIGAAQWTLGFLGKFFLSTKN